MANLSNPPRNAIGDPAGSKWLQFAAAAYLDHRHRNWLTSEALGDVLFMPEADTVLVHRERAEHIAQTLFGGRDVLVLEDALALPARTGTNVRRQPPSQPQPLVIERGSARWRDILGWIGIVAGAAMFVTALVVPLDDPALVVALAMGLRGGRLVLDV